MASLAAVGFPTDVLMQFASVAGIGSLAGKQSEPTWNYFSLLWRHTTGLLIGRRITATKLPQTVAALHSVVGLAAVMTSIGSVMLHIGDISTLHLVTGYLGVLIGMANCIHSSHFQTLD
jgi:H+-translocating NAD(P) transhydrogenase